MNEVIALRRHNEELRARLAQLEALFGDDIKLPLQWRLTADQGCIVAMLFKRTGVVGFDALIECVWNRIGRDEPEKPKVVLRVQINSIRNAMRAAGQGSVQTIWGVGYRLDDEARSAIAAVNGGTVGGTAP